MKIVDYIFHRLWINLDGIVLQQFSPDAKVFSYLPSS